MFRVTLIAALLGAMPLSAATAQPSDLRAAIDGYLSEDYSDVSVIAGYAEEGVPEAVAILGQAYLYGNGLEPDRPLGVALLEQAASMGERSSAVYLGRVFEFGVPGIPADLETAAKWYVDAAEAGDTASAPAALKRLPRSLVIASGGAAWAAPEEKTAAVAKPAPAQPRSPAAEATRTVFDAPPAQIQRSAATEDGPDSPVGVAVAPVAASQAEAAPSPASALLGTDVPPPPLVLNDGTSFPVFADSKLSPTGDAAASCFLVLKPEIERQKLALESLMKLDGATAPEGRARYEDLASTDKQITAMSAALKSSENLLASPRQNGGLNAEAVRLALVPHREAMQKRPASGPTPSLCGQRLVQLIGESAGWDGGGR